MWFNPMTGGGASGRESAPIVAALTDVLRSEARLLRELAVVIGDQKDALAATDNQAVEDSVYAIHRVLHTLSAARERRRSINRVLAETEEIAIGDLESLLGDAMNQDLQAACDDLKRSAGELGGMLDTTWNALRIAVSVHASRSD